MSKQLTRAEVGECLNKLMRGYNVAKQAHDLGDHDQAQRDEIERLRERIELLENAICFAQKKLDWAWDGTTDA